MPVRPSRPPPPRPPAPASPVPPLATPPPRACSAPRDPPPREPCSAPPPLATPPASPVPPLRPSRPPPPASPVPPLRPSRPPPPRALFRPSRPPLIPAPICSAMDPTPLVEDPQRAKRPTTPHRPDLSKLISYSSELRIMTIARMPVPMQGPTAQEAVQNPKILHFASYRTARANIAQSASRHTCTALV